MQKSELSESLIREGGGSSEEDLETHLDQIRKFMQREKSRLRQMKWITLSLWLLALVCIGLLKMRTGEALLFSDSKVGVLVICLSFVVQALPVLAVISTVLLALRLRRSSGRETNQRLIIIEERLRQLERRKNQVDTHGDHA